jgi:hypothetical protein
MEPTQSSETLAYKIQTPGKFPEDYIVHSQHGESLKIFGLVCKIAKHDSFFLSVRRSTWNNAAATGRIFAEFDI